MDLSTLSVIASLQGVNYLIIFFLFVAEGPVLNFIAAFVASLGYLNIYIICLLAFLGNMVGDVIWYLVGRYGTRGRVKKHIDKVLTPKRIERIEHLLKVHPGKTLTVIKISQIFAIPGLLLAGYMKMSLKQFVAYVALINIPWCGIFLILGYFSGAAYATTLKYVEYSQYVLMGIIVLAVIFFLVYRRILKRISNKIERV